VSDVVYDKAAHKSVAKAVAEAAIKSGAAKIKP